MKGLYFLAVTLVVIILVSGMFGSRGPAHTDAMFPVQTMHDALHFGYEGFEEDSADAEDATAKAPEGAPEGGAETEADCEEDKTEGFRPQTTPDSMIAYTGHEYAGF